MDTKIQMTASELLDLPDDGQKYELVHGELIRMSPTGGTHGKIASRLDHRLRSHVESHNLGEVCGAETGFQLTENPDTVRAPDLSFVSFERIPMEGVPDTFWPFAPDLAVEVVSPNDRYGALQQKVKDYLQAGTRMVWVADPRSRTVTIYRSFKEARILTETDTLHGEDVVPGFTCSVKEIFA